MDTKKIKILEVLNRADCCCPLGYISLHTNLLHPLKILADLEEAGYVTREENDNRSPSHHPLFKITHAGQQVIHRRIVEPIQVPLTLITQKYA